MIILRLYLKNEGQIATAAGITAELTSSDASSVSNITTGTQDAIDIPAGQRVKTNQTFKVITKGAPDTLYFHVTIYSKEYHYWSSSYLATYIGQCDQILPKTFSLSQTYPNPLNSSTKIKFDLPKPETVTIDIYNIIGQKIETLLNQPMPAGYHKVEFNGQNLSSGVYLYKIKAGAWQDVKKMVLLR